MRKVFFSAATLTFSGLMLHAAFACELNLEASQPALAIVLPGVCSGSNCVLNAQQDPFVRANEERSQVDPVQDCGPAYFDPTTYSGRDGLLDWLMALLDAQSQYRPAGGLAPSPMDANARYR